MGGPVQIQVAEWDARRGFPLSSGHSSGSRHPLTWLLLCSLLVTATLPTGQARAQWLPDGTPVSLAPGRQIAPKVVADGAGGAYVVWYDERPWFNQGRIYAQRVNGSGQSLWTQDGVAVCDGGPQWYPIPVADADGGLFVVLRDMRSGDSDVYVQRLTAAGTVASGWPAGGIAVAAGVGNQELAAAVPDGVGGVLLAWTTGEPDESDISALRIDGAGSPSPGWPANGVLVCDAAGAQNLGAIVPDGSGGAYLVWEDHRTGTGDIYAQHLDGQGSARWAPGGVPVCLFGGDQLGPRATLSGQGLYIAWFDYRANLADIYLQRLELDGTISSGWPDDGFAVCTAPYSQYMAASNAIIPDGVGGVLLGWSDGRHWADQNAAVYAQRVDAAGAVHSGWPPDGVRASQAGAGQERPLLVPDGLEGAVLVWWEGGLNADIYAQRISGNSQVAAGWPARGIPVCTAPGAQYQHSVALLGPDAFIVAWDDSRDGDFNFYRDIYAQRVRLGDGAVGDHGVWSEILPGGSLPSMRDQSTAIHDPVRERMVLFGGRTNPITYNDVWFLSLTGSPAWAQIVASGVPPDERCQHSAIYDPVRDRMIVFGGEGGDLLNDVWALTLAGTPTWTELSPTIAGPLARAGHTAIYDPVRDRMIVFGGSNGNTYFNDVWALSLSGAPAWSEIVPAGPLPPGRSDCGAVFDPVRDRLVVFGGQDGSSPYRNDVWTLTFSGSPTWSEIAGGGSPPQGLAAATTIFDQVRERLVVFGGVEWQGTSIHRNTAWALALSGNPTWEVLSPLGVPPEGRLDHAAIYEPARDRMLAFGGRGATTPLLNDTWALTWGVPASPPVAPSDLQATTLDCGTTIDLSWSDNSSDETGFEVQWKVAGQPDATYVRLGFLVANTTQFSHQPGDGLQHTYRVRAYRGGLFSGFGIAATSPPPGTPPPAPSGLKVENLGTGNALRVAWDEAEGATSYELHRSDGVVVSRSETEYTDTDLEQGRIYSYYVVAVNECGESAPSQSESGRPDYFPVLLVHGIWGSPGSFSDCAVSGQPWQRLGSCWRERKLGDRLVAEGLRCYAIEYDNAARLVTQVPILRSVIDAVLQDAGESRLIVVAHSQGGLITRSLLQLEPEYGAKITRLVMLGTPNHGAALARACLVPGLVHLCQALGEAAFDLSPASDFLNGLNYQGDSDRKDRGWYADCGSHQPEDLALGVEHWVIAGTGGKCKPASFAPPCESDGVVAVASAFLAALVSDRELSDVDLPGTGDVLARHYSGPIGLFCVPTEGLLEHGAVGAAVNDIIKTGTAPNDLTTQVARAARETATDLGKTTALPALVSVGWASGNLESGSTAIDVVVMDGGSELVVVQYGEQPLDLLLRSPSGRTVVPADSVLADVEYDLSETGLVRALLITAPEAGTWAIESTNPAATGVAYRIEVLLDSTIPLRLDVRDSLGVDDRRTVLAAFDSFDQPLANGTVVCSIVRPDGVRDAVEMFDDGAHADGAAGDGILGGTYLPTIPGFYFVELSGVLPRSGGPDIHRAAWGEFAQETFKDLAVSPDDVTVARPVPVAGDSLLVSVVVRNEGVETAPAARVRFASKGAAPGPATLVSVPAGEEATAQGYWLPVNQQADTLVVTVDANYAFTESRMDNNRAQVALSPATVSVAEPKVRLELGLHAYPNPARGTVTFWVSVPSRTHAVLRLYDLAGRVVATPLEGDLQPGPHRFEWRRVLDRGGALRPGVYFYELRALGQRSSRRIVLLR